MSESFGGNYDNLDDITKLTALPKEKTAAEYAKAVERLRRFAGSDTSVITAAELPELTAIISGDLQTVATARGVLRDNERTRQQEYMYQRGVGKGRITLTASAFFTNLNKEDDRADEFWRDEKHKRFHLPSGFGIMLPVYGVEEAFADQVQRFFLNYYHKEYSPHSKDRDKTTLMYRREGKLRYYWPFKEPHMAESQQIFKTLLQEGVGDIVRTLPAPTPAPNL